MLSKFISGTSGTCDIGDSGSMTDAMNHDDEFTHEQDLSAELNAQSEVILNTDTLVSNADQLLDETGKITASLFALRNRILLSQKIKKG